MVVCRSLICATIEEISSIAATAAVVSPWIASTRLAMSSVAFAVSCASSFTSLATTAKPLPASPARAASIVAFSASRLVCSAMLVITLTTLPISAERLTQLGDRRRRRLRGGHRAGRHLAGLRGVRRRSPGWRHPSARHPRRPSARCGETSSAALDTTPDWAEVSSADAEICADERRQLLRGRGDRVGRAPRPTTAPAAGCLHAASDAAISPTSSRCVTPVTKVRSPCRRRPARPGPGAAAGPPTGPPAGPASRRGRRPGRRRRSAAPSPASGRGPGPAAELRGALVRRCLDRCRPGRGRCRSPRRPRRR